MRVYRHLRRMVTACELLVVMVDAELGVELEEVQALLPVSRQTAPEGPAAAVEAHKMRLVRSRPVPVVAVRHVLVELTHRTSELLLQAHNILLYQTVATPCFGLANSFTPPARHVSSSRDFNLNLSLQVKAIQRLRPAAVKV